MQLYFFFLIPDFRKNSFRFSISNIWKLITSYSFYSKKHFPKFAIGNFKSQIV